MTPLRRSESQPDRDGVLPTCSDSALNHQSGDHAPSSAVGAPLADDVARLRAAGIKVTAGRLRVLRLLSEAKAPLCHAELEAQLALAGNASIDRVTLYRILDAFVQHGLLLKASDARGIFRYSLAEVRHGHSGHLHFRCIDCGGVFCLEAAPPPPPALPDGFRLREASLDLRGHCAQCAANTSDTPREDDGQ